MATAQILQVIVEKALDTDAEPVDPKLSQTFEVCQRQRVGIGFKGDFSVFVDGIRLLNKL